MTSESVENLAGSAVLRDNAEVAEALGRNYAAGFVTDIESVSLPPGLDEGTIRQLSAIKREPEWMTEWRLEAFRHWQSMPTPDWAKLKIDPIDYQAISYYSAPKQGPKSLDEVDPALLETYEKLGVPLHERAALAGVAVDAVFDSVSVGTTFRKKLAEAGVIFCSMSEAIREHPELVRKYLGSVVPQGDNYFAALNSAVFSDGSFVFVPAGVRCPMELSTYFRINAQNTGQFERTLIVCEDRAQVSYLEGCTAPRRDENQLHAAVVELVALEGANIKYSTVQNWYPGDENGVGGIYNFVTKRGDCRGADSKISWTQVETGSAVTWKYPSVVLRGDRSVGEFYSVALTHHFQQADTGTKMIHLGKDTKSKIVSKGISAGRSSNSYRGLVKVEKGAERARNYTQCDSLLIGKKCGAHTFPYMEVKNPTAIVEHEATTSKISDDQLFYCRSRGIGEEDAVSMIVDGFCKQVFRELPMEFAVEAKKLLEVSLEGAVG
ncbi:Fe-S cluster assembly protein SufB [Frateuria terrea]|uniref:Fe-S cluster assembly protein SufB n=1 Tax=Frateuria terrea TaxID=529704 RepID=A0A1H6QN33_9GAMM|nr:Fe-S cluster assembly protein SufB [Frateuria terrea]SEI43406.1 Fe-S cluster assembly protein SufB [Frateuria terrea]SFP08756.1 Fe-S cluster assembly protein SufB [Frateuria terrea]